MSTTSPPGNIRTRSCGSQKLHHAKRLAATQDERRFLLTRERPAVTQVVAWAAGNGDRSETADYQYGKRRLREIDRRIRFLVKRIDAAELSTRKRRGWTGGDAGLIRSHGRYANASGTERVVSIVGVAS